MVISWYSGSARPASIRPQRIAADHYLRGIDEPCNIVASIRPQRIAADHRGVAGNDEQGHHASIRPQRIAADHPAPATASTSMS